jgi:hypothetical protein
VLFYNTALQRESVIAASAGTIVGQTIFPTAVGFTLLGDDTRPGFTPLALAGFGVAVLGALLLARFGDVSEDTRTVTPDTGQVQQSVPSGADGWSGGPSRSGDDR